MKRFRFQLEMALQWRKQRVATQQAVLEEIVGRRTQLLLRRNQLLEEYERSESDTLGTNVVTGDDLRALDSYRRAVQFQQAQLLREEAKLTEAIERQRKVVMEENRQCKLLERLKERKQASWQREMDRELENDASDGYLAKWNKREGA